MQNAVHAAIKKLLNRSINGYTLLKAFGEGGQGCVFLAEKDETKKKLAVKVIPPDFTAGNDAEKGQKAEEMYAENEKIQNAYLMQYVDHFRVNLKVSGVDVSTTFLVMELCSGGDLSDVINKLMKNKEQIKKDRFMRIFAQSCVGMYVLYKNHIMHRDLKPGNIFLDQDENAKIADFGCGKQLSMTVAQTTTVVGIGTMGWMAPEFEEEGIYSFPADVWSFARIFFFLATLSIPNVHPLALPNEARRAVKINPEIPQAIAEVLVQMLLRSPDKRPTIKQVVRLPEVQEAIRALPHDTLPEGLVDHLDSAEGLPDAPRPPPRTTPIVVPPAINIPDEKPIIGVPKVPAQHAGPSDGEARFEKLTDDEFVEIFKVTRAEFMKYAPFKQKRLKGEKNFG